MNTNIADRPLDLAVHLRTAVSLLRSGTFSYNWKKAEQCNCGLLARVITGTSAEELRARLARARLASVAIPVTWSAMTEAFCPIAGVPANELFAQLYAGGMRFEDFHHLEYMTDPTIRAYMEKHYNFFQKRKKFRFFGPYVRVLRPAIAKHDEAPSLIGYLESWATLIEEHHAAKRKRTFDERMEQVETRPLVPIK